MSDALTIAEDRFPVDVVTDDTTLRTVRLIMTRPTDGVGLFKVWTAPDVLAIDTTFDLTASNIGPKQADWGVVTEAGPVVVKSSPGCGCGNRLKWWSPPEFQPYKKGRPLR